MLEVQRDDANHPKVAVKLLVALVIGALALVFRKRDRMPKWLLPTLTGLVVLNVGVAVFWD